MTGDQPHEISKAGASLRPSLILASTSPRRRELLSEHGYDFTVIAPEGVVESADPKASPGEITLSNAKAKAAAVARLHPNAIVLGVDTEVFFEGRVLGKPATMEDAFAMVRRLNGKTHEVYSGVCLMNFSTGKETCFVELTHVQFHQRSDAEIHAYLERIHPLDKAGGYAAQNDDGEMIAGFDGSYSNVIGLPMEALECALADWRR